MTTASTTTVIDQTSDAAFRTWIAEIITMFFTTLGLTQTSDTGQINTSTVTRPVVVNTAAGYVVGRFNDTAQSTSPIFFKLEFGTGSVQPTNPALWITVGTNSNGSGTITGTTMARTAMGSFGVLPSTTTAFVTRGCYNAAAGFLGFIWKIGGISASTGQAVSGFFLFRSSDNTGTVTTDSVHLLASSGSATSSASGGVMQVISYLTSTAYNSAAPYVGANVWGMVPFTLSNSLFSGNTQLFPIFSYTPVVGITPWCGICLMSEFALNSTDTFAVVGATTHTYISIGSLAMAQFANQSLTAGTYGLFMLWE